LRGTTARLCPFDTAALIVVRMVRMGKRREEIADEASKRTE